MKKLLVLMLVLGLASLANATVTYTWTSDAAGTTAITQTGTGTTFYLVISGLVSDFAQNLKLYDDNGQGGYADFKGLVTLVSNGTGGNNAGNLASPFWDSGPTYDGVELIADQFNPVAGAEGADGDWAIFELLATALEGDFVATIYDSTYTNTVGSVGGIEIVPEPMTMVLLGMGGLFLRRRK